MEAGAGEESETSFIKVGQDRPGNGMVGSLRPGEPLSLSVGLTTLFSNSRWSPGEVLCRQHKYAASPGQQVWGPQMRQPEWGVIILQPHSVSWHRPARPHQPLSSPRLQVRHGIMWLLPTISPQTQRTRGQSPWVARESPRTWTRRGWSSQICCDPVSFFKVGNSSQL